MAAVTSRYARAFAEVVIAGKLDPNQTLRELQSLAALVASNTDLRRVWENPAVPAEQKRGVLDAIVAREGTSRPVRNLLAVLIDHRRIVLLDQVVKQFEQELNQRMGFAEADIASARELSDAEKRALESQVERMTGKKVRARYTRDESLLGGATVRLGSTIYDGSVKGQLEKMRERLSGS